MLLADGVALGSRRLRVIDVVGGRQPIFNEDQSVAVVLNGEIYNFAGLRARLAERGHRFKTATDTEVLVHLYEDRGPDFVQELDGMFALALWDFEKQLLILARDRIGVKPLFYYRDARQLVFGSEPKAVLQDDAVPREIDFRGIHQLLTLGHTLSPATCFAGLRELPPATLLLYKKGQTELRSYWDPQSEGSPAYEPERAACELRAELRGAVSRRLVADVPVGAFLSGGIDSGTVVALMSELSEEPVRTFSIGFEDRAFSELPYARMVAERYGTKHHEMIVTPRADEILGPLIAHHDAPFYDTSAIPMFYLSAFAREHVTVALSGDGGDELFAGYNIHRAQGLAERYLHIPEPVRRLMIEPASAWVPESHGYTNRGRVLREFLRGAGLEPLARYTRWATKIKREVRDRLYQEPQLREQLDSPDEALWADFYRHPRAGSELARLLFLGMKTELPGDMLVKVDRMSSAHGLEVRSPLLDHRLFELAARLPDGAKIRRGTGKYLLRQVAKTLLPKELLRRPKRGFSVPLDRWLREDMAGFTKEVLCDSKTKGRRLFDQEVVRELMEDHQSGRVARGRELWLLLTIELWQRAYIDELACRVEGTGPDQDLHTITMGEGR
jgi:asparagine synthase (glutamine-hydrolysing)